MWFVVILIFMSVIIVAFFDSTTRINTDIKRITEFVFGPCDIKPYKKYSKEELKSLLGLFDKSIFL